MHTKFKLVIFGILLLWCLLLAYLAFSLEWTAMTKSTDRADFVRPPPKLLTTYGQEAPVQVMLASDANTIGGMIAVMHSVISNTKKPIHFFLVTTEEEIAHLKLWIAKTKLNKIAYSLAAFPTEWVNDKILIRDGSQNLPKPMTYARFYAPKLFPGLTGRLVYLENDVIVQGDISELANSTIHRDHYGAFSVDCESVSKRLSPLQNTYASYINFNNPVIHKLKMSPTACSFNTGVYVVNITTWKSANLTQKLEYWLALNTKEEIYTNNIEVGGSQPPMMIVFYKRVSKIDPIWHVRHLGVTAGSRYSRLFVLQAKLLHWDGHFKPWGIRSAHTDLWDRYFLADPTGQFKVTRKKKSGTNS